MNESPLVLVTGASGALGPAVVNLLGERGYRVRGLGLAEPNNTAFTTKVEWFTGDICDARVLDAAMLGAWRVVHMAALLHINQPPAKLAAEYRRVNVEGTQAVVDAALRHGAERVVFMSTIAVYGYGRAEMLTEGSETRPNTLYAQTKLEAERIVTAARRADGQGLGVVLRLAAVYGSRVRGNYSRLVTALAAGRFLPIGDGDNRRTLVYDEDVAASVRLALEHPRASGRVYNVTDGEIHSLSQIIEAICDGLGRSGPRVSLPAGPLRLGLGAAGKLSRAFGRDLPINSAMLEKYLEDVAVDGSKLVRELNFRPAYDLATGWRDAIGKMRHNGSLPRAR